MTYYEVVYVGRDNDSGLGVFPTEAAAEAAIDKFYRRGGRHDDPYGGFEVAEVEGPCPEHFHLEIDWVCPFCGYGY